MKLLPLLLAVCLPLFAQAAEKAGAPAGFNRKILQDRDLSLPGHHAVVAQVDFAAGAIASRHTHPGEELGYIIDGTIIIEIDGQPAQTLKAGDSFFIPAGAVHSAKNGGTGQARVVSSYVLAKGKPLATPAAK